MEAFLLLNGYELRLSDDQIAEMFERLGADEITQGDCFDLISRHAQRAGGEREGHS